MPTPALFSSVLPRICYLDPVLGAVLLPSPNSDAGAVIVGERVVEEGGGDLIVRRGGKAAEDDNPGRAARITVAGDEVVLDRHLEAIVGGPVVIGVASLNTPPSARMPTVVPETVFPAMVTSVISW